MICWAWSTGGGNATAARVANAWKVAKGESLIILISGSVIRGQSIVPWLR
jgi:hypothetical protein